MNTRRRYGMVLLALLGLTTLLAWRFWPRPRLLMERATRIALWKQEAMGAEHHWLSDTRLLVRRSQHDHRATLFSVDLRTGQEIQNEALNRLCDGESTDGILPSPDARWILWKPFDGEPDLHLYASDGAKQYHCDVHGNDKVAWLEDSQRWIEFVTAEEGGSIGFARIRHVEQPDRPQRITITPPIADGSDFPVVRANNRILVPYKDQGFEANKMIKLQIAIYLLEPTGLRRTRCHTLSLPSPALVQDLNISPQGDRVAWLLDVETSSPLAKLLHRFFHTIPAPTQHRLEVWVSNVDGSHWHEIGGIVSEPFHEQQTLLDLQWLPSGKRISFMHSDDLYTVPAD